MNDNETTTPSATNAPQTPACAGRREALKLGACACIGFGLDAAGLNRALADEPAEQRPTKGARLVVVGADGTPKLLAAADVKLGEKPVFAFPYDTDKKLVRDGSRYRRPFRSSTNVRHSFSISCRSTPSKASSTASARTSLSASWIFSRSSPWPASVRRLRSRAFAVFSASK